LLKRGGIDGEAAPAPGIGKKKCVVALDIGTDASNLIITDGARIIWQRPIPVGGNHFTRALTKELKLTFAKAEHLKRNAAKSPELANILKALRPVLQEFVGEVQRSLGYFTNTHRDAQVEYMVGLGSAFKLPGLQKFLADKLSLEVRKPDRFQRIAGEAVTDAPVFKENVLSFPVAYGLALQGLGIARLSTNLLPPEISFDRKIRAKKPYAVAAAAALLLGTTVLAYGYSVPLADATDSRIKTSIDKAKSVVGQAGSLDKQISDKKAEIDKTQMDVESIIAGQSERKNWIDINKFINEAVPIPGPVDPAKPPIPGYHNMVEPFRMPNNVAVDPRKYWDSTPGKRAIVKLQERVGKGVDPINALADDDMREYLAMVDIEAVYCRYVTDLKAFYDLLETNRKRLVGGPLSFPGSFLAPDDWWERKPDRTQPPPPGVREEKKPESEGWVFEIRGSTYWHPEPGSQADVFIMETFLRNLIERSRPLPEPKTDEEKKKLAEEPIRGKISHAFLYTFADGGEDKNPAAGTFRYVKSSVIEQLAGGGTGSGGPGMGEGAGGHMPAGPGVGMGGGAMLPGGGPPMPGGMGGGGSIGGWAPLGSAGAGGGASGGMGMGMGMGGFLGGGAGGPPAPGAGAGAGLPPIPGGPGGPPGPVGPAGPGGPGFGEGPGMPAPATPAAKGIKVKPRYEFVIIFAWKEPTPSDKLRPIKKYEPPATTTAPSGPGGLPGGGVPAAPPASKGSGETPLGAGAGRKGDID
jgi:hypothetical protein